MLSTSLQKLQASFTSVSAHEIVVDGKTYHQVHIHLSYVVSALNTTHSDSLVDCGANSGIAGNDVCIIHKGAHPCVNACSIDNHEVTSIPLVNAGGVAHTQFGDVIIILNQYAHHPHHKTIHSSGQIEWFHNDVNDKSTKVSGGLQCIKINDCYIFPL